MGQRGLDATLHVETKSGNAIINLQVGLGEAPPPFQHHLRRHPTPSQVRRHQRRAEARQQAAAEQATVSEAPAAEAPALQPSHDTEQVSDNKQNSEAVEAVSNVQEVETADDVVDIVTKETKETVPPVVKIYATAVFDDSPDEHLGNDAINSLSKLVKHKEHLENNVQEIEWKLLSTREFRANRFKHTAEVILQVKTESLWEMKLGLEVMEL